MAQSDLRLTGDVEPRNETARLKGRAARPAKPGIINLWRDDLPRQAAFSQARKHHFWRRRSFVRPAYHPCDGPYRPKGNACPFVIRWPPRLTARARSPGWIISPARSGRPLWLGPWAMTLPSSLPSNCTPVGTSYAARSSRWAYYP